MSGATMMMEKKKKSRNSGRDVNRSVRQENRTGIPTPLKDRMELSTGLSFDDVRVHYNSDLPARLDALAYTMGNQVEIGPGQEQHLPHELGHVVQQKLGIVRANARHSSGVAMNTDSGLEHQADEIGAGKKIDGKKIDIVQRKEENVVQRLRTDHAFLCAREADAFLQNASSFVIGVSQIVAKIKDKLQPTVNVIDNGLKDVAKEDDGSQDTAGTTRHILQNIPKDIDTILQNRAEIDYLLQLAKKSLNFAMTFVEYGFQGTGITNSRLPYKAGMTNIYLKFVVTSVDYALRVAARIDSTLQHIAEYIDIVLSGPTNNDLQLIAGEFNFTIQDIEIINGYLQFIIEKIDKAIEEIRKYVRTSRTMLEGEENKPHGQYAPITNSHTMDGLIGQNSAADQLAKAGYDVEMLEEKSGGNGYGINNLSNPDFLIGRLAFDCYTPAGPNKTPAKTTGKIATSQDTKSPKTPIDAAINTIIKTIREKIKNQSKRIVLNLKNIPEDMIERLKTSIKSLTGANAPWKSMKELVVILPNGSIDCWFFREEE